MFFTDQTQGTFPKDNKDKKQKYKDILGVVGPGKDGSKGSPELTIPAVINPPEMSLRLESLDRHLQKTRNLLELIRGINSRLGAYQETRPISIDSEAAPMKLDTNTNYMFRITSLEQELEALNEALAYEIKLLAAII